MRSSGGSICKEAAAGGGAPGVCFDTIPRGNTVVGFERHFLRFSDLGGILYNRIEGIA